MSVEYIRRVYEVPAKRGMRVTVNGKPGVIASFRGAYIMVRFDGAKHSVPCHPQWEVQYHESKPFNAARKRNA